MKGKILSQKRKSRREQYEEDLFDAMRYLAQATPVLDDILPKLTAAMKELRELESLKKSTPASERTPEWEAETERRITACREKEDALATRWERFDAEFSASEPATRH